MSAAATAWAWSHIAARACPAPGASLVLLRLADRADPEGVCWPGAARTARDLGMSPRGVQKCIDQLKAQGLITVTARRLSSGGATSNLYRLALEKEPSAPPEPRAYPPATNSVRPPVRTEFAGEGEQSSHKPNIQKLFNLKNNNSSASEQVPVVVQIENDLVDRGLLAAHEAAELKNWLATEASGQVIADELAGAVRKRGRDGPHGVKNALLFARAISRVRPAERQLTYAGAEAELREARARAPSAHMPSSTTLLQAEGVPPPQSFREFVANIKKEIRS